MKALYIGLIVFCYSLFLIFISPKNKKNMFGYKSFQQQRSPKIWEWTNVCFGVLILAGSILYLIGAAVLESKGTSMPAGLNKAGLVYLVLAFLLTEVYGGYKLYQKKKEK